MIRPTSAVLVLLSLAACKEDDARLANAAAAPEAMVSATVIASGRTAGGEAPRIVLIADGKEVGQTLVTASREGGEWGSYAFGWRGSRPNVLVVRYVNDSGDRDLWVRKVVLDGADLTPESATYLRDGRESLPGRSRMSWAGELRFEL